MSLSRKQERFSKVLIIPCFLLISSGIVSTHLTGHLFPGLIISTLLVLFVLLVMIFSSQMDVPHRLTLSVLVGVSVFQRVYIYHFPQSLIGIDPPGYALQLQDVIESGGVGVVDWSFYSSAPLIFTTTSTFGVVSGESAPKALAIIPIATGLLLPLAAVVLTLQVVSGENRFRKALVAGVIAAITTQSVLLSYWPVAQSLAVALWAVLLVVLLKYYRPGSRRHLVLLLLLLLGLMYTHKAPLAVVGATLTAVIGIKLANQIIPAKPSPTYRYWGLTLVFITAILLYLQWGVITGFLSSSLLKFTTVATIATTTETVEISPALADSGTIAAVEPLPGLPGVLYRRIHGFVLVGLGGLAWLYAIYTRSQRISSQVLLAAAAGTVGFLGIGILTPDAALQPPRALFFAEFLLAALVAVVFVGSRSSLGRRISYAVIALIVVSQLFTASAVPDTPESPRLYLTGEETHAKEFGHQYVEQRIHTDFFAASTTTPKMIEQRVPSEAKYSVFTSGLLFQTLIDQNHEYIMFRKDVDVYRTGVGLWKPTWEPERTLDREYNKVYVNERVGLYSRPR